MFRKAKLPYQILKSEPELDPTEGETGTEGDTEPQGYQSVHNEAVKGFYESIKSPHETMGYFHTPLASPKDYLKKNSKDPKFEKTGKPFTYPDKDRRKPPVPTVEEMLPKPAEPKKDFITENVRRAIRAAPRKPVPKIVDTKKGDIVVLEFSGLVPKYCMKKEFGITPKYLVNRNADMEYDKMCFHDFINEEMLKRCPQKLSEEGQNYLLQGLTKYWTQLHHEYLGLSLMTDTLWEKNRKECMEDQLRSLEQDLVLLQRHDDIFVIDAHPYRESSFVLICVTRA